jgi:hypothetical protein
MKSFKELEEAYGRSDAYSRDYRSSVSGMGKHQSAAYRADGGGNDERHDLDVHHSVDHPHSVHINGKKWKTFGSQSHASNVAKKIKGATVHKEEVQIDEAGTSAAIRMQKALEKIKADRERKERLAAPYVPVKSVFKQEKPVKEESFKPMDEPRYDLSIAARQKRADDAAKAKKEKPIKEDNEHYEEAEEHLSKANDAEAKGHMKSFHTHMADHHDAMSEWHDSKGRSASADKHADKAEYHHEKSLTVKEEVDLNEAGIPKNHTIEAHGIRGMKSTPWRKTFKNHEHLSDWADKNDSVEVHATRDLDQAKRGNLSPAMRKEAKDPGEYDYEGQMARTQLQTTLRNCEDLIDMIKDDDNMPEWVQSKITLAQDYITTVRDYLQSKEELGEAVMLKQNAKLAAINKAREEKMKSFKQHVGKK